MLLLLGAVQLILYVALLSLAGQGLLHLLAGSRRDDNVFYRLLRSAGRPFTAMVRCALPQRIGDAQATWITFALLAAIYAVVTLERIDLCLRSGLLGQAGCR